MRELIALCSSLASMYYIFRWEVISFGANAFNPPFVSLWFANGGTLPCSLFMGFLSLQPPLRFWVQIPGGCSLRLIFPRVIEV